MPVQTLARLISILGHPAVLSPMALLVVLAHSGSVLLLPAAVAVVSVASVIMLYSYWKVRTGRWKHIDASISTERRSLNPLLASIFGLAALLVNQVPGTGTLSLGFLLGGCIPVLAILLSKWMKLSQHVAFAGFTATWLWSIAPWLSCTFFVVTASIAWSRMELKRHTFLDVCGGIIVGVGTGAVLMRLLQVAAV